MDDDLVAVVLVEADVGEELAHPGIAEGAVGEELDRFRPRAALDPVLRPKELYESQGRADDYSKIVDKLKSERTEYLRKYPALSDEIVDAVR